ncbi:hypothetical protein BJ944DRAFT_245352 [Cunninghamella echinulata]|nr:hypothetical protein BJ944DRAFT_245352 [Cunninghamella echinulata]
MEYVESAKLRNKKRDRTDRLKLRLGMNAAEVKNAMTEEQQATDDLGESKRKFDECQTNVKNEIKIFETQKTRDLTKSMTNYAHIHLRYERAKLTSLEKTLKEIRSLQPHPISPNHPFHMVMEEEEQQHHASSSSTTTNTTSSSYRDRNNSNSNKRRHHTNQHRPQKTLQSSMSLPTWTRKHLDSNDIDNDEDIDIDSNHSNSGSNSNSNSSKQKNIKRTTSYEDHHHPSTSNPSHLLSSSYDERLGVRKQSTLW